MNYDVLAPLGLRNPVQAVESADCDSHSRGLIHSAGRHLIQTWIHGRLPDILSPHEQLNAEGGTHMNAAIYCRVSTDDQEKEGTSLTTQLEACQKYCQDKGYTVVKRFSETYSGITLDRP